MFKSTVVYKHQKLCPQYCRLLSAVIFLSHLETFITDPAILFSFNLCFIALIAFRVLFKYLPSACFISFNFLVLLAVQYRNLCLPIQLHNTIFCFTKSTYLNQLHPFPNNRHLELTGLAYPMKKCRTFPLQIFTFSLIIVSIAYKFIYL